MKMKKKIELLEQVKTIKDFRKDKHKIEYPLYEIIFMSLFGLLKGHVTFSDLHGWMQYNEKNEIFKKLFKKEKVNVPSRSTLHNLLMKGATLKKPKFIQLIYPKTPPNAHQ